MKKFFIAIGTIIVIASIIGMFAMFNNINDMRYSSLFYDLQDSLKMGAIFIGIGGILLGLIFIGMGYIMDQIDGASFRIERKILDK